jgi:hypothetical protein
MKLLFVHTCESYERVVCIAIRKRKKRVDIYSDAIILKQQQQQRCSQLYDNSYRDFPSSFSLFVSKYVIFEIHWASIVL